MKRFSFRLTLLGCTVLVLSFAGAADEVASWGGCAVTASDARPWEKRACAELTRGLALRVRGSVSVDGFTNVVFHVGNTAFAAEKGLGASAFADEQWCVKSFGRDVVLNGGGTHGALYAVAHFLEDCCGFRWWSQIEEDVPPSSPLALGPLNLSGRPAFRLRDIYPALHEPSAARMVVMRRLNGSDSGIGCDLSWGGGFRYGSPGNCHTFNAYLPKEDYFAAHPDWFSFSKKTGRRLGGRDSQICLTHPGVRAEVKQRLRAFIVADRRKAAASGVPPPTVYDLSENDNHVYCECEACEAAKKKWGMSGLMLDFVNDVASSIRDDYPGILVNTFAYHETEEPPKGGKTAADNVMVRLCNTRSNQTAGNLEPGNLMFVDFLSRWSKVVKHLSVWDYSINYTPELTGLPFASEFRYGDYFRTCLKSGVWGFFFEHESQYKSDFHELKFFLETKLMEDPSLDANELIAQFMREYYGPAARHMTLYRQRLDALRKERKGVVTWFPSLSDWNWIREEDVTKFQTLFDLAQTATGGREPYLSRVKRGRLGLDRLVCLRAQAELRGLAEPAVAASAARIRVFWPDWMSRYKSLKATTVKKEIASVLGLPPPKKFAGHAFFDFPAFLFSSGGADERAIRLADDPESEAGRAYLVEAENAPLEGLPYHPGLYDRGAGKSVLKPKFEKPIGPGYNWYCLGTAPLPESSYIWLNGSWRLQCNLCRKTHLAGKTFTYWVSAKFTGRRYVPGSTEPSRIWVDRVVLDPVKSGDVGSAKTTLEK